MLPPPSDWRETEDDYLDSEYTFGNNELRLEAFNLDFEDVYSNRTQNSIALLIRQISNEALDILYGDNIVKLKLNGEGEYDLKKNFTKQLEGTNRGYSTTTSIGRYRDRHFG
jgi:hypothetical protein